MPNGEEFYSPRSVLQRVKTLKQTNGFQNLHYRMLKDQQLYDLFPFLPDDAVLRLEDKPIASDLPQTFADKVIAILSQNDIAVDVPQVADQQTRRANGDMELFNRGMLRAINREQFKMGRPDVISQLAYQVALRGWVIGRGFLNVRQNSRKVFPDVRIWDSMDSVWQMDSEGLSWMATNRLIPYDVAVAAQLDPSSTGMLRNGAENAVSVWEYQDRHYWCMVTDGIPQVNTGDNSDVRFITPPTPHNATDDEGQATCPGFVVSAGARVPRSLGDGMNTSDLKDTGESIYSAARDLFEELNYIMSLGRIQTVSRTFPKYHVKSDANEDVSEDIENPLTQTITTRQDTDINPIDTRVDRSAGVLEQYHITLDQAYRATLPELQYGESQRGYSGFALAQLGEDSQEKLLPFWATVERSVGHMLAGIKNQFQSGQWGAMDITGPQGYNGGRAQKLMDPRVIAQASDFDIQLVPKKRRVAPEVMAQVIQGYQSGLMSLEHALRVIGVPNPEYEKDRILVEQLEAADPILRLNAGIKAFARSGDIEQATFTRNALERIYYATQDAALIQSAESDLYLGQLAALLDSQNPFAAAMLIRDMQLLGAGPYAQAFPATPTPLSPYGAAQPSVQPSSPAAPRQAQGFTTGSYGSDTAYGTRTQEGAGVAAQNAQNARAPRQQNSRALVGARR